ncbi:hypothetical protein OS12_04010 [Dickeya oryzae]
MKSVSLWHVRAAGFAYCRMCRVTVQSRIVQSGTGAKTAETNTIGFPCDPSVGRKYQRAVET